MGWVDGRAGFAGSTLFVGEARHLASNLLKTQTDDMCDRPARAAGVDVETVALSVPYMVLSTRMNTLGEKEERVITPFGCVDIVFSFVPESRDQASRWEIQVGGDIDCWLVDPSLYKEFKVTFVRLIEGIVHRDIEDFSEKPSQLYVRFKGEHFDLTLPWQQAAAEKDPAGGRAGKGRSSRSRPA